VNDQWTVMFDAVHESRLQLLNAPVIVRVVEQETGRIRRRIVDAALL